jgi:ribonuclease J
VECGVEPENARVIEDGRPFSITPECFFPEDPIDAQGTMVDGKGVGDVGQAVLKERHLLGGEGVVVVVMVLDEATWSILQGPEIFSKGFVFEQQFSHVLEDAKCLVLDCLEGKTPGDLDKLQESIRGSLRRFFRKVLDRDPIVVPVVTAV